MMAGGHTSSYPVSLFDFMTDVEITCDKPYYDGFCPSNLLDMTGKGFMAERFVKPPVTLTVKFPCSIRIKAIDFSNTVGSFTSSSFEILSYYLATDQEPTKFPVYKPIGRCYNSKPGNIAFINPRYRVQSGCFINRPEQTYPLSTHDGSLLNSARFIAIRITHTLSAGIPVLKDLVIIGYPLTNSFFKQPSKTTNTTLISSDSEIGNIEDKNTAGTATDSSDINNSDTTPQEFIDPLTCEVMSLPIILPSGYTIDQSTLNKHIDVEKGWGRKPSDPFTGLPLTESNPPIVHDLLKQRIDHHALVNDIAVGRTTGRKRPLHHTASKECSNKRKQDTCNTECTSGRPLTPQTSHANDIELQPYKPLNTSPSTTDPTISSRLSKVLAKASKFRTVEIPKEHRVHCVNCMDTTASSDSILYKLGVCEHVMCKCCLLTVTNNDDITCSKCGAASRRSQVTRFHAI